MQPKPSRFSKSQPMLFVFMNPFHHQHNDNKQIRGPHSRPSEKSIASPKRSKLHHPPKILPSHPDALRPENNPPNDRQKERQKHLPGLLEGREQSSFGHLVGVLAVLARQYQRQEQNGVVRAPGDERPVRAVPETRQQEDDEGVPDDLGLRDATAAQGDVDIIPEPSRQADVPPAPELGDVATEVGYVEVAHQLDPEELRRSDGDVGVAREVAVDLESEEDGGEEQGASALHLIT